MNIAILGYGRMGRTIEKLAPLRGHTIALKISSKNIHDLTIEKLRALNIDIAIDFSLPTTAYENITTCFLANIPVVSGTTAWLEQWDDAIECMHENEGAFLYASNFSIGVNIFFMLNEKLAALMSEHPMYAPSIHEVHHTNKLDAPSGTAISLAEGLLKYLPNKKGWTDKMDSEEKVKVTSSRIDPAPGTHHVKYISDIDEIEIIHTAKSRDGFAFGAIIAAEFLIDKTGLYTMTDVLKLN